MDQPAPRVDPAMLPRPQLGAAFRELHGQRLHGFTLLITLGDRTRAGRIAAQALAEGAQRASHLRHPERAAAWLRARAVEVARKAHAGRTRSITPEQRDALDAIGVEPAVATALATLDIRERAVVVAEAVEGLGTLDVATVAGVDRGRVAPLRKRARRRYAAAYASALDEPPLPGSLASRIRAAAGGDWP
jgi:DNA-directed RNA polymerase specialized sigma24 family protein